MEQTKCGCGRSKTGYCTGLHKLTKEEWEQRESQPKVYEVDFDLVNTLEDMKAVLKGLRIHFTTEASSFEEIKHYLKEI